MVRKRCSLVVLQNSVKPADLAWRSPQFTSIQHRLSLIYNSRYTPWLLLLLGLLRTVVFVIAYPPAHGADSSDYFLYAAQFKGLDAPIVFELIYPLYPLLIYLTYYVLGSIYWLIGFQLVLSAVQGVIFYWGLRLYSPALGFVVALMVLGDAQTGILYNFTSTEPLYMFLLNLAFCLYLVQLKRPADRRIQRGDIAPGRVASSGAADASGRALPDRTVWRAVPVGYAFLVADGGRCGEFRRGVGRYR